MSASGVVDSDPVSPPVVEVSQFAFAISDGKSEPTRDKRRRQVVEYVVGWLDGVEIVDEWQDELSRWVVVAVPAPVSPVAAQDFARSSPHYVPGSFAVDRWAR